MSSAGASKPAGVGFILKIALFATGCAGIVAEFVLSTLATYLVGNAVFQWTIVMSLMLFAMGLGSRVSRYFRERLLDVFILTEFLLSVLCAMSALLAYALAAHVSCVNLVIYTQAMIIGALIGMEIPLVTRINEEYEELRVNISTVMEKDYYGALAGGLCFAFFALPRFGLTYTPIALGAVNFLVAALILWRFFRLLERRRLLVTACGVTVVALAALALLARPVMTYGEQRKYKDKVVYAEQSTYQKIVMTRWRQHYWLYLDGQEQFSTFDEEKYHEPLVHPAMSMARDRRHILIVGGGDGLAAREVLKYPEVESLTLVDLDPAMTRLAQTHPELLRINAGSLLNPKVTVRNADAATFLETDQGFYDAVIIDLPDPDTVELMHVYSLSFYEMVRHHLRAGGVMVTQAASPYFAPDAFRCILKTVREAGMSALPYHNQVPTMGEWGWVLGINALERSEEELRDRAMNLDFSPVTTRFVNGDAMVSMIHFGKGIVDPESLAGIQVNSSLNPVLFRYYLSGTWEFY